MYKDTSRPILINNQIREFFKTTMGIWQWFLSPVLSKTFLKKIIYETLHNHHCSISISGTSVSNSGFVDDIDIAAGSNDELSLTHRLVQGRLTAWRSAQRRRQSWSTAQTTSLQTSSWMITKDWRGSGELVTLISQLSTVYSDHLYSPSFYMDVRHGHFFLVLRKRLMDSRPSAPGSCSASPMWSINPTNMCRTWSHRWWVHKNL